MLKHGYLRRAVRERQQGVGSGIAMVGIVKVLARRAQCLWS
jgi:hypothetical protein